MLNFQAYIAFGLDVVVRLVKGIGLLDDLLTHTVHPQLHYRRCIGGPTWLYRLLMSPDLALNPMERGTAMVIEFSNLENFNGGT